MSEETRLKAEIEHTREELGETVEALTHKVDVPARVRRRRAELGEQVRQVPANRWAAVGGALAVVAVLVFLMRAVRS
jgi:hypothetical protein